MERWNCSFDELVSKHTDGQIAVLSSGASIWQEMIDREVERRSKQSNKGSRDAPATREKHVVSKKKYKTAAEYMAAMDQTGM